MILKVSNYCSSILLNDKCAILPFHNLEHTKEVVSNVYVISKFLEFTEQEMEPIIIAAWFHDTGHSEIYQGHESVSKRSAEGFLRIEGYPKDKIATVLNCIEATKMPQSCTDKYSAVLCDADIFHIGTNNFFFKKLLLRREWDIKGIMQVSDLDWHRLNLKFLCDHHFKTLYGKEILKPVKLENEEKVKYILSFCG